MKRIFVIALLIVAAKIFIAKPGLEAEEPFSYKYNDTLKVFAPEPQHKASEQTIATILSRFHYRRAKFNDSLSYLVFNKYLETLDPGKNYFLDSDIKKFEEHKDKFDDYILEGELDPAYDIFNIFYRRLNERYQYGKTLLNKEFDFTKNEDYIIDRENLPYPKSTEEANEIWRKRIKNDALNLKLSGKDWKGTAETLTKRYANFEKLMYQYKNEDVFQLIMNSYTEVIDPHTNYLSPTSSEDFKIDMSRSLEGIGATLQQEDEYTKIAELVPGGPAFKSKKLNKGDRIVAVAQGNDGEWVDVIGWRITEVVQLIRGPKNSIVRLQVLLASDGTSATPKEVKLVRDKVTLEEQSAKKSILDMKTTEGESKKIGVITIPAFYMDFDAYQKGDPNYKSTTNDVKKLLNDLKKEKVDGVVVDLRSNGGGSLQEAIQLTGLFIKTGPVVQVKNSSGNIEVDDDPDPDIVYDGPLAVVVNKFSASASEIFAAAIQDYGRGIILGDKTFGKGTVQNLIDLNRFVQAPENKVGQLKVTISKFYRINGGSTQHKGVVPDILFPSHFDDPKEFGESAEPSALPYDQISSANYNKFAEVKSLIPKLDQEYNQRIKNNLEFKYLLEDIEDYKANRNKKSVSLNYEVRKHEKELAENKKLKRENERRKLLGLAELKKGETPPANEEKDPIEDALLKESANILMDLAKLDN